MGNVMPIVRANIAKESALMTGESGIYRRAGQDFASHEFVTHSKDEFVRGHVHTNTVEGFFSIFKRGVKGVYQDCAENHLHRYLAEFDFRYSNRIAMGVDNCTRAFIALKGGAGKRLTTADLLDHKRRHFRKPVQLELSLWRFAKPSRPGEKIKGIHKRKRR
ncbi:truncated transposase [Aminobacter sp. Y103A]|nr:truncated transposase [Aminobacter sp. SS-2016]